MAWTTLPQKAARAVLPAWMLIVAAAAVTPAAAETLCAYRTEVGALVYTNTPTNDGVCATAEAAPPIGPASPGKVARHDAAIKKWAAHYGVSSRLVHAVISAESAYNPGAVSPKGARGLMQLMPATARQYGVTDSFDPTENIRGGVALLRDLLDTYGGDTRLAVAAYNAGAGAVARYSGVPPYTETRQYVAKVMGRMRGSSSGLTRSSSGGGGSSAPVQMLVATSGSVMLRN